MSNAGYATPAAEFTRPNNTTAYAAGDVVGATAAAITFGSSSYPLPGGPVTIRAAELRIGASAVPSGMSFFTLHLYSVTPPSALADNAAFNLPSGDRASYLGSFVIGTPVDLGDTLYVRADSLNVDIDLAGSMLFGYLVTAAAWTPAAETTFSVKLHVMAV